MLLNFSLKFSSRYGQNVYLCGNIAELGSDAFNHSVPLVYADANTWKLSIDVDTVKGFTHYRYIIRDDNDGELIQPCKNIVPYSAKWPAEASFFDEWNSPSDFNNAFLTQPFTQVFNKPSKAVKLPKSFTHYFSVHSPLLGPDECVCLVGSGKTFGDWQTAKPVLLSKNNGVWQAFITIANEKIPIAYKYGIYNIKTKKFSVFESGENRIVRTGISHPLFIHDAFAAFRVTPWKGAGVSIPVFSLRTTKGFGTGEFADIKVLADWAATCNVKIIQLLPVNDTTATHTNKDSYPYAAISAFALHPLYINLEKVAGKKHISVVKPLAKKKQQLNRLDYVNYEQVMKFKFLALQELYQLQKDAFLKDEGFLSYFKQHRHWLQPYAAFCYLRDKYQSPDASQWKSNSRYDGHAIKQLCAPSQKHHDDIAVHYFIQYHLHLQLKEAVEYAHKKGIAIKGDLPIGVYRYGADAWQEPDEFIMDQQAGAPPDDFAAKGQNWGFPTYNWKKMQEEGFTWWQKRFEQMSHYFDAFRIDHILGFFRIWSIPADSVNGIMGRFVPAIPVHINEFSKNNIAFDNERFCKPYITADYLNELFGDNIAWVKETFFDGNVLKTSCNTQRKIEVYFNENPEKSFLKEKLFEVTANVLLFDEGDGQHFHFRYGIHDTYSYKSLEVQTQSRLNELYINYFYSRQDNFWRNEAMKKLPGLMATTNMLVCGEDLGMVPQCVPGVMKELGIMSLEIQRMPKASHTEFMKPADAPYASVITPGTHDMSVLRSWWEEDRQKTQRYYNTILNHTGTAPELCEPEIAEEILIQHLNSPSMLCIFQMQDLLGTNAVLRRQNPDDERINIPADPNHFWKYRMHLTLENLVKEKSFNANFKAAVQAAGR